MKKSRKPTKGSLSILYQICNLIPAYLVPKLAKRFCVDKKARTYTPWSHVVTLLYAHLAHASGLNDVCDALKSHDTLFTRIRGAVLPAKNTLSHANRNRDPAMAEALFRELLDQLQCDSSRFGGRTFKGMPRRFKRAVYAVDASTIQLVANNQDWAASSIADLYRSRWAIETFFKEIKQTLQLSDFLGYNKNAVTWQVWTALIVYILLRYHSLQHCWTHGFKRFSCLVRSNLWSKYTLGSLVAFCGTARGSPQGGQNPVQRFLPGFEGYFHPQI